MRTRSVTFYMECWKNDADPIVTPKPFDRPPFEPVAKRYKVTVQIPDWLPEGWTDPRQKEVISIAPEAVMEEM
jgi:hypothetical protein